MTSNQAFENCQLEKSHWKIKTTLWPQNISIWPKINIPSWYFTISMLNCLANTLNHLFDRYVTAVKCFDLTDFHNNLMTWPNSNTAGICIDSRLKCSIITHRYAKKKPSSFTWFLHWKLPIDRDFSHLICQLNQPCGINARNCFQGPAAPQQGMLGVMIVWWPASFWLQWTMTGGELCKVTFLHISQPNPQREKMKKCAIKHIKICAEYRDMLPRPRLDFSGSHFCFYLKHDIELYIIRNK